MAYFCSFIILSSMMILNLFIGVITSSMADAKSDLSQELEDEAALQRLDISDERVRAGNCERARCPCAVVCSAHPRAHPVGLCERRAAENDLVVGRPG